MPRASSLFNVIVYAFAAIMLAGLIVIGYFAFLYASEGDKPDSAAPPSTAAQPVFHATADKRGLEQAIHTYAQRNMVFGDYEFRVKLDQSLIFEGDVSVAGLKLRLTVDFEPEVRDNGDLVLHQRQFQVGSLPLPRHMVLEYVRQAYDVPDWIRIMPQDRQIYVAASQFHTQSGMSFRVREFDLPGDRIAFDIVMPVE